jgi:hypothetical protein
VAGFFIWSNHHPRRAERRRSSGGTQGPPLLPQSALPVETAGAGRKRASRLLLPGVPSSFYRSRCLVCEDQMKRKRSDQRIKSGHGKCSAEYRRFPRAYDLPQRSDVPMVGISNVSLAEAHFTGTFSGPIGERPRHRALHHWSWSSDELEHELRDAAGALLARLESNAGRHRLTCPRTTPILSWADLGERRVESFAVIAVPLAAVRRRP